MNVEPDNKLAIEEFGHASDPKITLRPQTIDERELLEALEGRAIFKKVDGEYLWMLVPEPRQPAKGHVPATGRDQAEKRPARKGKKP